MKYSTKQKYIVILLLVMLTALVAVGTSTWIITSPVTFKPSWAQGKTNIYLNRIAEEDYNANGVAWDDIGSLYTFYGAEKTLVQDTDFTVNIGNNATTTNGDLLYSKGEKVTVGSTYLVDGNVTITLKDDAAEKYYLAGTCYTDSSGTTVIEENQNIQAYPASPNMYGCSNLLLKYKTVKYNDTLYTIEDALNIASSGIVILTGNATTPVETSFCALSEKPYGDGPFEVKKGVTLLVPYGDDDTAGKTNGNNIETTAKTVKPYSLLTVCSPQNGLTQTTMLRVLGTLTVNAQRSMAGGAPTSVPNVNGQMEVCDNTRVEIVSGATFNCMGFAYGEGLIDVLNGSTVYETFSLIGWKGGTASLGMRNMMFPVNQFALNSIICKTQFNAGSKYYVWACLTATLVGAQDKDVLFISNGKDSFIQMNSGNVTKWVEEDTGKMHFELAGNFQFNNMTVTISSYSLTTSGNTVPLAGNFDITVKSGETTIPNGVKLRLLPGSSLMVEKEANITIESGAGVYSYGSIGVGNDTFNGTFFDGQLVKSYPKLTADHFRKDKNGDSTLTKGLQYSGDYITRSPAEVLVKGTVIAKNGSEIGVAIKGEEGGYVNIYSGATLAPNNIREDNSNGSNPGTTDAVTPDWLGGGKGGIFVYSTITTYFIHNEEIVSDNNGIVIQRTPTATKATNGEWLYKNGAWRTQESLSATFYANGGLFDNQHDTHVSKFEEYFDWQSTPIELPFEKMPTVTRPYYTFIGWSTSPDTNPDDSTIIKAGNYADVVIGEVNDLYAIWTPIEYTFNYQIISQENGNSNYGLIVSNWTVETDAFNLTMFEVPNLTLEDDHVLNGWYLGFDGDTLSDMIEAISVNNMSTISKYIDSNNSIMLYARVEEYFETTIQYVIGYPVGEDAAEFFEVYTGDVSIPEVHLIEAGEALYDLPDFSSVSNVTDVDTSLEYYFTGWKSVTGEIVSRETTVSSSMLGEDDKIVVTATWAKKAHVLVTDKDTKGYSNVESYDAGWYKQGQKVDLDSIGNKINVTGEDYNVAVETYFNGWKVAQGNNGVNGTTYEVVAQDLGNEVKIETVRESKVQLSITLKGRNTNSLTNRTGKTASYDILFGDTNYTDSKSVTGTYEARISPGYTTGGPYIYYLKPGQNYEIINISGTLSGGNSSGNATSNITLTITNG